MERANNLIVALPSNAVTLSFENSNRSIAAQNHVSIVMRAGPLAVRDALPSEAEAYVKYWHRSGEQIKNLLGIDLAKLGGPSDSHKRFLSMIRAPGTSQPNVIFSITLNGELVGYTNVNMNGDYNSYVHLHTYRSCIRAALKQLETSNRDTTGASIGAVLIGLIGMYFDLFPLRRVVFQTRTTNHWINRALNLYLPKAETKFLSQPAGLAAPGDYHLRYVKREDAPWMRRRAEYLAECEGRALRSALLQTVESSDRSELTCSGEFAKRSRSLSECAL